MSKNLFRQGLALAIAGIMMFGTIAYAAEEAAPVPVAEEAALVQEDILPEENEEAAATVEEAEEPDVYDDAQAWDITADEPGLYNDVEAENNSEDGVKYFVPEDTFAEPAYDSDSEEAPPSEELVGTKDYDITLNAWKNFSYTGGTDYQDFSYVSKKTGAYRVDVMATSQIRNFRLFKYESNKWVLQEGAVDNWIAESNPCKASVNVMLTSGVKYCIRVVPANTSGSGTFKLWKTTKDIKSASYSKTSGKYLTAGPNSADGYFGYNSDGTKNFDQYIFYLNKINSLFDFEITFTDGTKYTWDNRSDCEVGSTGILIIPEQITDDWKLGQKAYCYIHILNLISNKEEIPYKNLYFTDVRDSSHAYFKAIYWAANKGITKGYKDGSFGINKSCTRGEMMMFLWRFAGQPTPKTVSKSPFKDVSKSHTFYQAILWGSQKGITKGYSDGTFGINRSVTRGACMMFLWRLKGKPAPKAVSVSPFKDVSKSHAYYKAILWGAQKKITTGYTSGSKKGTFGINENCTRGAIVTFLYRAR